MQENILLAESKYTPDKAQSTLGKLWELSFAVLFLYVFLIQNAFFAIDGMLLLLCGLCGLFVIAKLFFEKFHSIRIHHMFGLALFVCVGFVTSLICANDLDDSIAAGLRMVEYLVFGCSLYMFITSYPHRFIPIIRYLWISITLLCVYVLIYGTEVTTAGAIGLETLNVNLLSSYIMIQLLCSLILIGSASHIAETIISSLSVLAALIVQILTASRRGFVINFGFVFIAILVAIIPRFTKRNSKKRLLLILAVLGYAALMIFTIGPYILEETALGQRFLGAFTGGDEARKKYQEIAMREFSESPLLGVGLNGLKSVMGVYSHSLYYETLACTGLTGTLILAITMVSVGFSLCKYFVKVSDHNVKDVYITKLCFLFLCALLLAGFAVTTIYDFYFYICVAMLCAVISVNKQEKRGSLKK